MKKRDRREYWKEYYRKNRERIRKVQTECYYKNIEQRTEYYSNYAKSENGKIIKNKSLENMRKKYPERFKARSIMRNAITQGKLLREPCMICGKKSEGHHEDYSKPLDVLWLCLKHHRIRHKALNMGYAI